MTRKNLRITSGKNAGKRTSRKLYKENNKIKIKRKCQKCMVRNVGSKQIFCKFCSGKASKNRLLSYVENTERRLK